MIPIPESSRPSAMQLAQKIGKPYREGFVKNRYVGRTFIMPGQAVRKRSVRQKLNAIVQEFKDRNVLLVDDSIVRGTTSKEIVQMAREAGARKVYMASAAPPVRYPNVYGIDMPTKEELIAHDRSVEEIRRFIGADALIYQDVDAMKRVVKALNPRLDGFEASCFDGVYITGDVSEAAAACPHHGARRRRRRAALAPGAAQRGRRFLILSDDNKRLPRTRLPRDARLDTLAVREGLPPSQWGENSEALFISSSFVHPDAATAAARFANEEEAFVYSRFTNPTVTMMERRLAALEGSEACIGTASGMGAITMILLGLLKSGDHVICSHSVFGSTIRLLNDFAKFGVQSTFVSQTDVSQWRDAVRPNTRLLFAESPTNPLTEVCDIAALAKIAHDAGAWLAVDNCFCSPALQQPIALGADIVMHSGTKYLDGQGRVIAGALCCSQAMVDEKFMPVLRTAGITLSPFNAWVVLKGMETLSIRMREQSARALELARWLEQHLAVERVLHPGLPSHPQHELAMRQQNGVGGPVASFVVRGKDADRARANAFAVLDATRVCSITANLGDTKTTITHPASTTHGRLTEAQRLAAGITQGAIRIAVGLEDLEDLKADLARGLDAIK